MDYQKIIVDHPLPRVQRITLNRPEKRNPLSNELRTELFHALEAGDQNPDIRVTIIRGAGSCFSAGYDLQSDSSQGQPFYTPGGLGNWPRHVVEGFFHIWDLAKPVAPAPAPVAALDSAAAPAAPVAPPPGFVPRARSLRAID